MNLRQASAAVIATMLLGVVGSRAETLTVSRTVPAYTEAGAFMGQFAAGTRLEVTGPVRDGRVPVRYAPPGGQVIEAWCRATDLGLATPPPGTAVPAGPEVTVEALNREFGLPLWKEGSLWAEPEADVAGRLRWPRESRTSHLSIYRAYFPESVRVLGARPYTGAIYFGPEGASELSFVFANKGDAPPGMDVSNLRALERAVRRAIDEDAATLEAKLTELFGRPQGQRIGVGSQTRENARRWDWNGHAILLVHARDEYVALRIVPEAFADARGRVDRIGTTELRQTLAARVVRRDNGDVVVGELPMINQGPKGYCVPATWERYLRYLGIPADMYVLALAGQTRIGGGTTLRGMTQGAQDMVRTYGRDVRNYSSRINLREVSRAVDRGFPLMWSMRIDDDLHRTLTPRTAERARAASPDAWNERLAPLRREARRLDPPNANAHACMIIGYNEKTRELAVSDSWGPAFEERWITEEEAQALNLGGLMIIE